MADAGCLDHRRDRRIGIRPLAWLRAGIDAMESSRLRRQSARRLMALGDHELRDIGLDRADAARLARDPDALPDRLRRR